MHQGSSWAITEGQGRALQIALYVRDALGLVDGSPDAVPPLVPAVPRLAAPADPETGHAEPAIDDVPASGDDARASGDDVRAWRVWFELLLADTATGAPGDPLGRLLAAGPTRALGAAATALLSDAETWCAERKIEHIDGLRRQIREDRQTRERWGVHELPQAGERRLAITRLVADVEGELGRRAAPFTLHIVTLPVAGAWARRERRDLLLLSEESRHDSERLRDVLTPVVLELA